MEENGRLYKRNQGTEPGPPETYFIREDSDSIYVDWSFQAKDETRTFTLK